MSCCVVNFACPGREKYLEGQKRLAQSLKEHGDCSFQLYSNTYPPKCPTHQDVPYAFKWYAIQEAFNAGHTYVMWLDASIVALRDMTPIWNVIKKEGYVFFRNAGCPEHMFTSKDCLDKLGCSLEEARKIEQVSAGIVGFNKRNHTANGIIDRMLVLSRDGVSFQGGSNTSPDPKFVAHRHDQSCLSFILHKRGIKKQPPLWVKYTADVDKNTILEIRGMGKL